MLLNRSNLNLIFSVFLLAILVVMIKFFTSAMGVNKTNKTGAVTEVLLSNIGSQDIVKHSGWPALIIRNPGNQFVVWDLKPRFSNGAKARCMITVFDSSYSTEAGARFGDLCSGTRYASNGRVIEPSPPFSLSMRQLDWSIEGAYLIISHPN